MDSILEYFIEEPERELHIRELARFTRKSPATVSKYLNKFKRNNILISRKKFNHLLFRANTENQSFKDLKLSFNIKKIRKSGLIDYLIEEFNHPEAIILFGSFRKAENSKKSDIDLLVTTPKKREINLEKFEKRLQHKIQLFLYSNVEIKKIKTKNKGLLNNLVNGIALYGYWELFK